MLLPEGVARVIREEEGLPTQPPGGHDAAALEEVVRHVGGVALVALHRLHVTGERLVRTPVGVAIGFGSKFRKNLVI